MDEEAIKRRAIFGNEVGYGKPPKDGQFKKGQSGNPKGRPKKSLSSIGLDPTLAAILDGAENFVPVRESGKLTEISMREALVKATFAGAVKGNARSQALLFDLLRKAEEARAREVSERNEGARAYKRAMYQRLAEAKAKGEPPPSIVPHPDDVIIDQRKGPRIIGPADQAEVDQLNYALRFRDALIMQDVLDHRSSVRLDGTELKDPGAALLMAMLIERSIPERFRLTDGAIVFRTMKYEAIPKPQLLKQLYGEWHRLGFSHPRGFIFPSIGWMREHLEFRFALYRRIQEERLDPSVMSDQEWTEAIGRLAEGLPIGPHAQ